MTVQESSIEEAEIMVRGVLSPDKSGRVYEVNLVDVLIQLARRKRLIARVAGIALVCGIAVALLLPPQYSATTKIMPPQQSPSSAALLMSQFTNTGAGAGSFAALGGSALGLKNPNDIYVGMLNSRPVTDAIVRRFDLEKEYHSRDMTDARKELLEKTEIVSEKSGIITISVLDKDKKQVAAIANAYTDQLRNLVKTLAVTEASQRRIFYEQQLSQAKESLMEAEASFQQVEQKKGMVQPDAQTRAMIETLAAARAGVAAKHVQIDALRSYSTDNNPEVELAEHELISLQKELAGMEGRSPSSSFDNLGMEDVPGAGLEYFRADHEVKYRQALFDLLIRQYDAARIDEVKEAAVIQVLEPAIEPDHKTSPKRVVVVLLFVLGGLVLGCGLVWFELWTKQLRSDPKAVRQLEELKSALIGRHTDGA